ncbi:MAG TPA: ElyC/SanA/YdcF family protein, partial [Candidatus Nitrosotenuis sp.]|nr:ElyC/SanA/YdcF family protein [Candidatus Nitrosotenuis sp.]
PAAAVLRLPSYAENTRQEANLLLRITQEHKWKRVLVVTSNFHTRRARLIFNRVFDGTAEIHMIAARDGNYDPRSWWRSRLGVKHFFSESVSFFVALWETRSTERAREGPVPAGELKPATVQ